MGVTVDLFWIDGHVTRYGVTQLLDREIFVDVIKQGYIGALADTLSPELILEQLGITARHRHIVDKVREGLEHEGFAGTAIALVILPDDIVHDERRPSAGRRLEAVHHVADSKYLVYQALLLFLDLISLETLTGNIELVGRPVGISIRTVQRCKVLLELLSPIEAG